MVVAGLSCGYKNTSWIQIREVSRSCGTKTLWIQGHKGLIVFVDTSLNLDPLVDTKGDYVLCICGYKNGKKDPCGYKNRLKTTKNGYFNVNIPKSELYTYNIPGRDIYLI